MNKKILWIIIIFLILVGAGGYFVLNREKFLSSQKITDGKFLGTILGTVSLGPNCPVVSDPPDLECADKPYQTKLELVTQDGTKVIKEFSSDKNGKFSIGVGPGKYSIRSKPSDNPFPYCKTDEVISVLPNKLTEVMVLCDTGIR